MPKVISSFASLSSRPKSKPVPLDCSDWNVGPIFNWYRGLNPESKAIRYIQIRRDASGPVPHRFIVVRMCDDHAHRFDRRPDRAPTAQTHMTDLIFNEAVASEDSYVLNISLQEEERVSECEIELNLDGQVDLIAVIAVCFAISADELAKTYTFLRHNCFFFSWTILTVISRYHLPYELPLHESIITRFGLGRDRLATSIVNHAVALFLDLVIDTVVIFRDKARSSMPTAMGLMGRGGAAVPNSLLKFLWRRLFKLRLRFGLRTQLMKMVKKELDEAAVTIYRETLSNHVARTLLDKHLWIEATRGAIKAALETEIMKILWRIILKAISSGLSEAEPEQLLQEQLTDPQLNFTWLGRNVAELCTIWGAALKGGLRAVHQVGQDTVDLSHNDAFDKAWEAARDAALKSAQDAAEKTRTAMHKPERDAKWLAIWSIWEECWGEAHDIAQPRSVETVKAIVEELLVMGAGIFIEDMRESRIKTINARKPSKRKWPRIPHKGGDENLTNTDIQEYMYSIIKKNTLNMDALEAVSASMERVWDALRESSRLRPESLVG